MVLSELQEGQTRYEMPLQDQPMEHPNHTFDIHGDVHSLLLGNVHGNDGTTAKIENLSIPGPKTGQQQDGMKAFFSRFKGKLFWD